MNNDLISREALKDEIKKVSRFNDGTYKWLYLNGVYNAIDNAPTVTPTFGLFRDMLCSDCEKRPQGEWIENNETVFVNRFNCSECGRLIFEPKEKNNFCPNCGADMRGDNT